MATLTTHDVRKVIVGKTKKLVIRKKKGSRTSYCRHIMLQGDEEIDIVMFSDKKETLELIEKID